MPTPAPPHNAPIKANSMGVVPDHDSSVGMAPDKLGLLRFPWASERWTEFALLKSSGTSWHPTTVRTHLASARANLHHRGDGFTK
jgi:hypothetical protein